VLLGRGVVYMKWEQLAAVFTNLMEKNILKTEAKARRLSSEMERNQTHYPIWISGSSNTWFQ
jgi:Tfp pilus assembly major pilin PilA